LLLLLLLFLFKWMFMDIYGCSMVYINYIHTFDIYTIVYS
jgi:hypothetical protein